MTIFILFSVLMFGFLISLSSANPRIVAFSDGARTSHVHHGIIREDALEGDEVELDSSLVVAKEDVVKGDICGYTIYANGTHHLPFKIVLLDRNTGQAKIVLAPGFQLDHEVIHEYNFEISAHDCKSGSLSERERVHVEVEDVNEYSPIWQQNSYNAEASEGQLFSRLVQLEATDGDGVAGSSKICHYHVLTPNVPFEVDADGYLRNTEPLDYSKRQNYIIKVIAEDCGHRRSDVAVVTVDVKSACRSEWIGIPEQVEFTPRENRKAIVPRAELRLCTDVCNVTRLAVTFTLTTSHIGKGCDRDTYSLHSQRKICGAVDNAIDLLPRPDDKSFTKEIPTDDGRESDQIFAFDGHNTAIEVPTDKVNPAIGWHFTVSMWMKHEEKDKDGKTKKKKVPTATLR